MGKTNAYHSSFWNVAKPLILSTLCGCAMIAALLAIAGFVLLKLGQIQPSVTSGIVIVISALSALFSGLVVGRTAKQNGLILGGITGLLLSFLLLIASVSCGIFQFFTVSSVIRFAVMILAGALGGLLAVNKRSKTK